MVNAPHTQTSATVSTNVRLMNAVAVLLFALVFVAVLYTALWRVIHLPVFAITQIHVTGQTEHSNTFIVRSQVLPRLQGNFFTVRLDDVRAAFLAQPWVRNVIVRRVFPNQLVVHLQEHEEAALWGNEEKGFRLLSTEGLIFEANPDEADRENLPELDGPDAAAPQVLSTWLQLNPLFGPVHSRISRLSVDTRGSWSLALNQDTNLLLGNASTTEMQQRIDGFVQTVGAVVSRYDRSLADLQYADLRYKTSYAIRLKGVGTLGSGVAARTAREKTSEPVRSM